MQSEPTLEIDRTQPAHLISAEQNFQKGYTLHIDHERRHCQFRKRWSIGSLHCAYAHALEILDALQERYPTSFKITGERHNGDAHRRMPPTTPKREVRAITAELGDTHRPETSPQTADEPSAEDAMNTHIADEKSAQEGVETTPPLDEPHESTVDEPALVELTRPTYTSSELADETGISGRRIWRVCQDQGVVFTREEDGLHFTTNTALVQALYQRFGLLATITLESEPGEGEPIIQQDATPETATPETEEASLDGEITMTLEVAVLEKDAPEEEETAADTPVNGLHTEATTLTGEVFSFRSSTDLSDLQAETKRVLKDLVDAVIDGETALITQNGEQARQIEDVLTRHGVELKRRADELLGLASQSRSIRRSIAESHS